jgi:salicylate hydroxylase
VVHTGHRCTGFEQNAGMARVTFANGASAEGRHRHRGRRHPSELRPYVFSTVAPVFPALSPTAAWCRTSALPHWPVERWQMWLGSGKHFLAFPVRAGTIINYVASCRRTRR